MAYYTDSLQLQKTQMKKSAILIGSLALLGMAANADEECYGVVLAGDNDCATATNACAGHSLEDGQKDAYIELPDGLCLKLKNGSLTAG